MPQNLRRIYGAGDLHFVTFSCYRRLPLLASPGRRDLFLKTLEQTRKKYEMVAIGYVVMPEHVHLLLSEPGSAEFGLFKLCGSLVEGAE